MGYEYLLQTYYFPSKRHKKTEKITDIRGKTNRTWCDLFLALSLQCAHCKEQFFKIYKAMQKGELKNYRIKIAISPSPQEAKVIEALAATAIHESMEKAMELLATWYETQNRKLFLLSVKKNLPMEGVKKSLEKTNDTVGALGIEGLPFVALDGYEITPTIFWAKVELE